LFSRHARRPAACFRRLGLPDDHRHHRRPGASDAHGVACTAHAWAQVPPPVSPAQRQALTQRAAELLRATGAVLVAHYYVDGDLQDLALATGGCVADSPGDGALRARPPAHARWWWPACASWARRRKIL
jgi:hypothetical protein